MSTIDNALREHLLAFTKLQFCDKEKLNRIATTCIASIRNGSKIMFAGNGGSSAEASHAAAELVVRLKPYNNRKAIAAISLNSDVCILTACGNDFGYENIFARQVEALGNKGDVLILLSTSGNSTNLIRAVFKAQELNVIPISFTGQKDNFLRSISTMNFSVPSDNTAAIQEMELWALHVLCELIEDGLKT